MHLYHKVKENAKRCCHTHAGPEYYLAKLVKNRSPNVRTDGMLKRSNRFTITFTIATGLMCIYSSWQLPFTATVTQLTQYVVKPASITRVLLCSTGLPYGTFK